MTVDQIVDVVATQYRLSEQGSGATFVRLAILLTSLIGGGDDCAYAICARVFPLEHSAWQIGFSDIDSPHAGRFATTFNPETN